MRLGVTAGRFPFRPLVCIAALCLSTGYAAAQVSLYTAVDLALRNSHKVQMAVAEEQRAEGALSQSKDAFVPSVTFGSSLGYSYGFPIGQPSIYNLAAQSLVFNFSQLDYIRSARDGVQSSRLSLENMRQQVAEDAALTYIHLDKSLKEQSALDDEYAAATRLVSIVEQRLNAGLDSKTDYTQARLTAAQIHLKQIHIQDDIASLREHMAHLTGLPATDLTTEPESIPAAPQFPSNARLAVNNDPGVQAAYANAHSKLQTSFGDARQMLHPEVDFSVQYSRYARFNNYADYYKNFQENNLGIGVQITLPLFDASRRARAAQSAAEAVRARHEADQMRNQAAENTLSLEHGLRELAAQQQVASLERELAQDQLDSVLTQIKSGSGTPNATPLTPKDEEQARIAERQKYINLLDVDFQLTQAQLNLLRATGRLESWVKSADNTRP
ncbi:MAG: TolC family protein [Acidobacteriaceae bacterium]